MNDSLMNVHIVAQSGNSKTGPIPATYRPESTCPASCPFLRNGCYGNGRIFGLANRYSSDVPMSDALGILRKVRKGTRILRDRVVGDIVTESGAIDWSYLVGISWLAHKVNLRPFGYTHAWRLFTKSDVRRVRHMGYVMNASCETREDVAQAIALGFKPVITNDDIAEGLEISGKRVVTCPAQTRDNVTCADCKLCANDQVPIVVRFLVHGASKNRARQAIAERMNSNG